MPQISLFSVSVMNLSLLIVIQGEEKCKLECAAISSRGEKKRSKATHDTRQKEPKVHLLNHPADYGVHSQLSCD